MASHQLTIEKAKFSAGLFKPDITTINREQVAGFLELLNIAVSRCSPSNIQSCKAWLLSNVVPSSSRVGVLGKYLAALAKAQDASRTTNEDKKSLSATTCRKRLHVLYLLSDILHHTKYHTSNSSNFSTFSGSIQPFLVDLIQVAAEGNRSRIRKRIDSLLQLWEQEAHFSKEYVDKLREASTNGVVGEANDLFTNRAVSGQTVNAKEQPYMMPASHGDPSTPYYDLPAGNMMPHIMPNRSVPIRSDDVRALQFVAGPADESLVHALKDFMVAVADIDNGAVEVQDREGIVEDVDELGQQLLRDETGELVSGRTYYGWSRDFCHKMKNRGETKDPRPGRERSYGSSRSRSRSPRKRRRYSNYVSSRSGSYSPSRSRDRSPYHNPLNGHSRGRILSERSPSRSRSYSPSFQPASTESEIQPLARQPPVNQTPLPQARPLAYPTPTGIPPPPSISPPNIAFNQYPFPPPSLGPGGFPIPPPPPANYSGPWPPPPPPPPPTNMAFNSYSTMQSHTGSQGYPVPSPHQRGQQHFGGPNSNKWQR